MQEDEFIEIDFILGLLKPNAQKLFNEIILARKNKMWSSTIVFCLAILERSCVIFTSLFLKKYKKKSQFSIKFTLI